MPSYFTGLDIGTGYSILFSDSSTFRWIVLRTNSLVIQFFKSKLSEVSKLSSVRLELIDGCCVEPIEVQSGVKSSMKGKQRKRSLSRTCGAHWEPSRCSCPCPTGWSYPAGWTKHSRTETRAKIRSAYRELTNGPPGGHIWLCPPWKSRHNLPGSRSTQRVKNVLWTDR